MALFKGGHFWTILVEMTILFNPYVKAYPNDKKLKSWMLKIFCQLKPYKKLFINTL
jgi:hypothetical protein